MSAGKPYPRESRMQSVGHGTEYGNSTYVSPRTARDRPKLLRSALNPPLRWGGMGRIWTQETSRGRAMPGLVRRVDGGGYFAWMTMFPPAATVVGLVP